MVQKRLRDEDVAARGAITPVATVPRNSAGSKIGDRLARLVGMSDVPLFCAAVGAFGESGLLSEDGNVQ